jgi:isocitrate dehydrogenase (NAD+)
MLDYIGEKDLCLKIRAAIAAVITEGKVKTYDMMKLAGRQEVLQNGAASTVQMTDAIIEKLKH